MPKFRKLLPDLLLLFFGAFLLIRPLFRAKYLDVWPSIESTFIADGRFLAAHWPHPLWQPLWYCGTRFDYVYPPLLRYGVAVLSSLYIPVKAYHVFTGLMFCLGIAGVYFLVRAMDGTRLQGWLSAMACALLSPSLLFIKEMRADAPWLMPVRLGVMIRYGEGPHISSLSLLPWALGFAFLGMRRRRPGAIALASLFCAMVSLTNFYGATALAIFYPVMVWSIWLAYRDRAVWLRAAAIPALAAALTAFWLTPSYFRITLYNLRYVSQPGNQYSALLAIAAALAFGVLSLRLASGKPRAFYLTFLSGSLLFMSLNVLGHFYFNFRVLGEPHRLVPELDMTMILFGFEALRRLWNHRFSSPRTARMAHVLAILLTLSAFWPARHFVRHAWDFYPPEPDYRTRVEYRMSEWLATHLPGARTFVAGSTRFWWDAWHDNAEVGGGSDQGLLNPNPTAAAAEILYGSDPALSVRWLQSLGADAIVVSDAHSQDAYHDYVKPGKFAGALPVLLDDHEGNIIYQVPRRYASLARVVNRSQLGGLRPVIADTGPPALRAYTDLVEQGPDASTTTHWNGTDSISVHTAMLQPGQSVVVQVTYDPAWRAYTHGTELPVHADPMDFLAIDAPAGTQDLDLVFETPVGNKVGYFVSGLALLLCISFWIAGGVGGARTTTPVLPEPDENAPDGDEAGGTKFSAHFRILRRLLRWLNRRLPEIPVPDDSSYFDAVRVKRAADALHSMKMPAASGDVYLEKHIPRLAKTLALVPAPQQTGRVLELGCYMQITPLLERFCGYREVRGAYPGSTGKTDHRTLQFPEGEFSCYVDHFDAERDPFPYPDGHFDLVVAGEIIEHMTYDPMAMLLESRRVLAEGGYLLISTPNVGSVTSAAKALEGRDNPQIYFLYERPGPERKTEIGHVREYTCHETGEAVRAAGFEVELLFTTFIEEFAEHKPLLRFLAANGYSTENRGEQTWCLARKRGELPVDRYPWFMYTS